MDRNTGPVKGRRRYDGAGRRAQAERTRTAMLEAAEQLLLANGYAGTTIASIAEAAGVSAETIYKVFGGKPGLVAGVRELRLAGAGPGHAEARSDRARTVVSDPRKLVARWGQLTAEVAPLVSPILLLVRDAAAAHPEMAALHAKLDDDRRRRMKVNATHLRDTGHIRAGVTLSEAVDVLWTYSSPDLYDLLVVRRGWSAVRYGRFVGDAIAAALLSRP
ncbi:MAG: TetR/AcrR family transcriptional regulator [Gemmatimonadota bacterium]|nr:TetR/AcrR family transcriptional regulator [Gemmatimonadota bacterium]